MGENILKKRNKETKSQHIKRLVYGKFVSKDLNDYDHSEIYKECTGEEISSNEARKRLYALRDYFSLFGWEDIDEGAVLDNSSKETISARNNEIKKQQKELKEILKEKDKIEKEITSLESKEERRLKVIDVGEYYTISSSKRKITISKDRVKLIKQLYCDDNGLSVSELCRKVNIPRRDFMLVKYAFDIVHNDVPYLNEELEGDIDALVNESLERKKEKYFLKLQEKEIETMMKELNKYREKDYLYDKIIEGINDIVIEPIKYNIEIKPVDTLREGLLDCADWHLGLKTQNYWNMFNKDIARERVTLLTEETIKVCAENGIKTLHVSALGDLISGNIHDSLIKESDIDVIDQIPFAVELIGKMLIEFSMMFDKVYFSNTYGNHGRILKSKNEATEKDNFEYLIAWGIKLMVNNYKNIIVEDNLIDDGIIVKEILGNRIFETHGHNDKFNSVAQDLTMMIDKPTEIHMAHLHSNRSLEINGVEVFMGRSFSGTDIYAKNIRKTGKAGQRLYIYEQDKRKYIAEIELN